MTAPFQHLLLATEHTEFDLGAERVAMDMARRCQLPLRAVLPMVSNAEYEAVAPQRAARADAEAANRLRALQDDARNLGVDLQATVRRGAELDREIVQEARERTSQVIIARQRGKRGFLARVLVGEMVSRVVAQAPCSVLLVPQQGQFWNRRVLLALDPACDVSAQEGIVRIAVAVAAECQLPMTVVCVVDGSTAAQAAAGTLFAFATDAAQGLGVVMQMDQRSGKAHEQIVQAAKLHDADLLVLGRNSGARSASLGNTAQKVIGLAERPVLVAIQGQSVA